ncbi:hypothetical protein ACN47E_003499 [Coniothyrium glycines]
MFSRRSLALFVLGAFAWLLLLSVPAHAAPTGIASLDLISRADKPDLPGSKDDLRKTYFKKGPAKDKSCFFTGMDVANGRRPPQNTNEAKKQCKDAGLNYLDMNGVWSKNNILNRKEWNGPPADAAWNDFIIWVSEIFAEETSGVAYLLITEASKPRAESIFYANEYKTMKDGGKVDKT